MCNVYILYRFWPSKAPELKSTNTSALTVVSPMTHSYHCLTGFALLHIWRMANGMAVLLTQLAIQHMVPFNYELCACAKIRNKIGWMDAKIHMGGDDEQVYGLICGASNK